MRKLFFSLIAFIVCISSVSAHIEDAQFVGGTGGSKILELNVTEDKVDSNGVIYDKNASLVYEITYTNVSSTSKTVTDIKLPDTDVVLSYDFSDIDKDLVIKPGESVKFQYSIKALDDMTYEELSSLNETAQAELVLSSVKVDNPETVDMIILIVLALCLSFVVFRFVKDKRVFYVCFIILISVLSLNHSKKVIADDYEVVNINTGIKYIFSNLAPSCANLDYEGDFCIDWKKYGNRDKVNYLVMTDTKDMTETYKIEDVNFTLQDTYDVSEQQNGDVILGIYLADTEEESYLFLIGQDDGVIVPKDASYQFTSYDSVNNKNEYDFHYVKYLDLSHFYSNKTTNMEYMLVGLGTQTDMEFYDLSGFETSNVTNMKGMFTGFGEATKELNLDVSMFDTSNVTDMSWMFWEVGAKSESINLDLSNFDTSKVTNMSSMFYSFGAYSKNIELNIYNFDTSTVTDMSYMFYRFNYLSNEDILIDYFKEWETYKTENMSYMFGCNLFDFMSIPDGNLVIDVTGLDTRNVTDMTGMFGFNYKLIEIKSLEFLDTSKVESMAYMFVNTDVEKLDINSWNVGNVKNMYWMFMGINYYGTNTLKSIDLSNWNVKNVKDFQNIFGSLSVSSINLFGWEFSEGADVSGMFFIYSGNDVLDLSYLNFVNCNDYSKLFSAVGSRENPYPSVYDLSGSDWNEEADTTDMFKGVTGSTIYVKDEKAKAFIEKQAPDCTVLIKE